MGLILLGCSTWKSSGQLKRHDYHRNFVGLAGRFVGASWGLRGARTAKLESSIQADWQALFANFVTS